MGETWIPGQQPNILGDKIAEGRVFECYKSAIILGGETNAGWQKSTVVFDST